MIRTSPRYRFERWAMHLLVWVFLRSRRRLLVEGLANVPASGPVILLCNHIATMDPPMVGSRLPRLDVFYMAKKEAFSTPFNRFFLHGFNAFPVVRHSPDRAALEYSLQVLKQGHVLVIFPEGSRSAAARLSRAFAGVGFLARMSGAPVVPAAIFGSENVLPRGSRFPRSAQVTIRFGAPVTLEELSGGGPIPRNREATDLLMAEVAALLPPGYRGVYGGRPQNDTDGPAVEPSTAA